MKLNLTVTKENSGAGLQHGYHDIGFETDPGEENAVVNLYPDLLFDEFEGFGGALTDSAAYIYSLMYPAQKQKMLVTYFSPEQMNFSIVRIHMDSCDFSTEMYEAMSDEKDMELNSFDFSRTERYIIPMLRDAEKAAGRRLKIMLSPWSPPEFMKTNGSRKHGGSLKPEYYELWAEYICRYIREFQERGFEVERISLQNEPKAVQTWDSCVYTAQEEKKFLKDAMYPELKLIVSESCIEFSKFDSRDSEANAMRLSHEIIGDLNNGVSAFYDWNVVLDEKGGPNHVGNYCLAPFLYDTKEHLLMPQLIQKHFFHFSHYIREGARRIGFSRYTDALDVTAYKNPDGSIALVLLNRSEKAMPVNIRINGQIARTEVTARAICTGVIEE